MFPMLSARQFKRQRALLAADGSAACPGPNMTTSPDGEPVPVERRLAEIHDRYGPGHLVSRSIQRATPTILRAVEQVRQRSAQTA